MANPDILYSIRNLTVEYQTRHGVVKGVDDVSLDIRRGEILGLVGESGSGKSTLGKAMMRLRNGSARITAGELWFDGQDLMKLSERQMRDLRGSRLGMVFQDPMTSLNPVQRIVEHLTETMLTHEPEWTEEEARERAENLVERLGIRRERVKDYPHQMSGGMRQRVMIALALALNCDLVIADEPTTSLDVIVEAKFLDLLKELRDEFNDVFEKPLHPYTEGLLKSVPNIELDSGALYKMQGSPPDLSSPPSGCRFHPRCPYMMEEVCPVYEPPFERPEGASEDCRVACWLHHPHPQKVAIGA